MNMEELQQALNYIPASEATYQEWVGIGMALKDAGCPVSMWDEWSKRDGRYHEGECARKWDSFNGTDRPLTQATIFKMASDRGWRSSGYELDFDDEIGGHGKEGIVVDKNWIEDMPLSLEKEWHPEKQLIAYLQALFEPTENVGYVVKSWQNDDGRYLPTQGSWSRTAGQLIEELSKCGGDIGAVIGDYDQEAGAWIRFNPLDGKGCKNDNVTEFRYALIESDELSLEQQNAIIHQLELPCAALVYSGGKSLHAIVRVDAPDYTEYRKRVDYLYSVCIKNGLKLDQACRNPSRLSRMPGIERDGKRQELLETNFGQPNWASWKDWIESVNDDLPDMESMSEIWNDLPPLAECLIDGILRQGHKMLLAGPSKAGKSFSLIELCISIAEGKKWMQQWQCKQGKVLYVNLELDRASCFHRFRDVYEAMSIPPKNLQNIDIWNLRGASVPMDKLAPKLIRRAQKKDYIAVVIDPIYKVITGDENSAEQMAKFCNQFDMLARQLSCSVIYCHHHSKGAQGGKQSMDRASGSGVFARDPDAMLDMIELPMTKGITEHLSNRAACAVSKEFLDRAGHKDCYSQDDLCSKANMKLHCEKYLSKAEMEEMEAAIQNAAEKACSKTAWRIEATLREFQRPKPVDFWFDYPVHRVDDSGMLSDIKPESELDRARQRGGKATKEGSEKRKEEFGKKLQQAFEASVENGRANLHDIASYLSLKPDSLKRKIKEDGKFWVEGAEVGRKF